MARLPALRGLDREPGHFYKEVREMFNRIRRAWRLFRPPPEVLPLPPRKIEVYASAYQPKLAIIDLIGFDGRLVRCVSVRTPVKLATVVLHSRTNPAYDASLASWLPNATIDATVGVTE